MSFISYKDAFNNIGKCIFAEEWSMHEIDTHQKQDIHYKRDIIGQGNSFGSGDKFGTGTLGASEPKWEPYPSIDLSKPQVLTEITFEREGMFDYMGNMKGAPQMLIPTPEQEGCNVNSECSGSGDTQGAGTGNTKQRTDSGDATNDGNSGGSEQGEGDNKEQKQQEKKLCVTVNQKLVFANAGYYDKDVIKKDILPAGNEQDSKVFETYEDNRLASKASVIKTKNGASSFNIAGTANPTEEGLENFMRDAINDVLIGTNSVQGILKDRVDWYISSIEQYNKESGNTEPLILNGHSSGGIEALIIATLRPDLVSQVNMVDSPGGYNIVLKLVNGDVAKASAVYEKVEIYNGNRNFVNSKGSHPAGKVIHTIDISVHRIEKIIGAYKDYGDTQMLGSCHSDSLCNYSNGEYTVERFKDDVTKKDIAEHFGLSEEQIEAIDNKALSDEDLAKYKNRISSKFKFKVTHERNQEEQCID
ncbi:MAG: hypothetical protein AB8B46_02460 [Candidatus Midichloriaceae bacterium]